MEGLVSIIVPAYNSALYIRECVDSVLAQNYARWELLLIDDGSQDSTRELCERMCERDRRIRLLCREHRGVSAARNAGIEEARGEYLFFLDSDDVIHPDLIGALYRLMAKSKAALAVGTCCYSKNNISPKISRKVCDEEKSQKNIYLRNHRAIHAFIWRLSEGSLNTIGGKMIRCNVPGTVRFREKLSHGEDELFIYQILEQGADVIVLPYEWYYYRRHEKSATTKNSLMAVQSRYRVERYIRDFEMKNHRMANAVRCEEIMLDLLVQGYAKGKRSRDSRVKEYAKKLAESERKQVFYPQIGWRTKLQVFLAFHCYPLYGMVHALLCCELPPTRMVNIKKGKQKERRGRNQWRKAE